MTKVLDTTLTQCPHGTPKCERCKNIRVINWISIKERMPEIKQHVLTYETGEVPMPIKINYIHNYENEFSYGKTENITHWADLSHAKPNNITICEHSGIQFNSKGEAVGLI